MAAFLQTHEPAIRVGFFGGVLAAMALWELLAPRRRQDNPRWTRWPSNLGLALLGAGLVRLVLPAAAVGWAATVDARGWGVFHLLDAPHWAAVVATVVLLDLAVYGQHVVFHGVPALWRLHRMHHADLDFDVTTGVRFHPVEILLSMAIKLAVITVLGGPAVAVLIFEVLLNASSLFNHGNVRMPAGLDRALRWVVVTPDMHRVHHSIRRRETDSNFGFALPWWDRLFGTYRAQPEDGHQAMTLGIEFFRTRRDLWLDRMLMQPLRSG